MGATCCIGSGIRIMLKNLRYIDALRGFAIAGVILVHTSLYDQDIYHTLFRNFVDSGARGVQLFFLVSAFTLFFSFDRRKHGEKNIHRNFFMRRLFRIIPMYYLGIIYYLWQNGHIANWGVNTAQTVFSNLLFIHGVNPYWITSLVPGGWSLSVEMVFYSFVPFLVARIKSTEQAVRFTIVSVLLADILNYAFYKYPLIVEQDLWRDFLFLYFPSQLPLFGLGIITYFVVIKRDFIVAPFTIMAIALLFIGQLIWGIVIFTHVLFGIGFFVIIFALSKQENLLIVNRFSIYLGKVSYSAYLVHFAVLHWMRHYALMDFISTENALGAIANFGIRFLVVLIVTVGISSVFYRFVEMPFIQLGKNIIRQREMVAG